jgi:hypothetical protein
MDNPVITFSDAIAKCDEMYRARPVEESPEDSVDAVIEELIEQAHYRGNDGDEMLKAANAAAVLFALDVPEE